MISNRYELVRMTINDEDPVIKPGFFTITALDTMNKPMWYSIDQPSGGYPYWTKHFPSADLFTEEQVTKAYDALLDDIRMLRTIYEGSVRIVEIFYEPRDSIINDAIERQNALNKLSDREKQLLGVK